MKPYDLKMYLTGYSIQIYIMCTHHDYVNQNLIQHFTKQHLVMILHISRTFNYIQMIVLSVTLATLYVMYNRTGAYKTSLLLNCQLFQIAMAYQVITSQGHPQ